MLMYGRNQHNIVKQLSSNFKNLIFLKKNMDLIKTEILSVFTLGF